LKKETKQLLQKAINGLIQCIDHFNRPWGDGRAEAVLILLDHAFEMLLKAGIRHRGGKIRQRREKQTIGFDACVRKALTEGQVKFLNNEQALTLQAINGQRDAAQHYLVDLSEHHLYFYAQAGVTLFRDIHDHLFDRKLKLDLPERVLPVSTSAPRNLIALFEKEIAEIKQLLAPGTRRRMEAIAKARSLAVLESTVNGVYEQPSDGELGKVCARLSRGEPWKQIFPGVASINITADGEGPTVKLRLTKNDGAPVQLIKEGEGGGAVIAVRRVDELGYYSLGFNQVAARTRISRNKLIAAIWKLKIQDDAECYKEFRIGATTHKRYSPKAVERIRAETQDLNFDEVLEEFRRSRARPKGA
jgi:hypothetical protein